MDNTLVSELFATLDKRLSLEEYNYGHFSRGTVFSDLKGSVQGSGIYPGYSAPDFELKDTDGRSIRLSEFEGKPMLIRFVSLSCPVTEGVTGPLKELYRYWGERVTFLDVFIRQAHPGVDVPVYRSYEQKFADAQRYRSIKEIPWHVLIDTIDGQVHQVYGGLPGSAYLVDTGGRIAFYALWLHVPTLHTAITALFDQNGVGVVKGGVDKLPHFLAPLTHGWPAIFRGFPQSYRDLERAVPLMGRVMQNAYRARAVLGRFTQRSKPVSPLIQSVLSAAGLLVLWRLMQPSSPQLIVPVKEKPQRHSVKTRCA